jgi:endonuclease/exonuclease/phosphatase family metal-dependent hydrolase
VIIGGDFNTSRLFDTPKPRGNAEFLDRVEEQFTSLHRRFHDKDERTFFGNGEHQLDYLYADSTLASRATNCWVVPREEVDQFSDHSPVVADLEI